MLLAADVLRHYLCGKKKRRHLTNCCRVQAKFGGKGPLGALVRLYNFPESPFFSTPSHRTSPPATDKAAKTSLAATAKQIVVVIGAGPGLGCAVARKFAEQGHPVAILSRSKERLETIASQINSVNRGRAVA